MPAYVQGVRDDEFRRLLDLYLEPSGDPNPDLVGVRIEWVRDNRNFGSLHISDQHDISEEEVEQVLLEIPPFVEAKRHPERPGRTIFWGATRRDRWLIVVCEDRTEADTRYLKPITAFEPDDGEDYWRRQ